MSTELPYFRFTAFKWLNGDISLYNYELKGLFSDVCAYYWFKDCSITKAKLKQRFSTATGLLEQLFNEKIIKLDEDSDYISISFLDEQYDKLSKLRKDRQDAGAKGGKQKASKARNLLKQKSSYKDKDKDKDILREREELLKIEILKVFQTRRFKNPNAEYEKFISHYDKTDWVDSNGNKIANKIAAAKLWDQKPEVGKQPEKNRPLDPNELWQLLVTDFINTVNNIDATTMILDMEVTSFYENKLTVTIKNKSSIKLLETEFFEPFRTAFRKYFPEPINLKYFPKDN